MGVVGQHHAPAALPPGKRHGTHFVGEWVGPRAGQDRRGKSRPRQGRPDRLALSEPSHRLDHRLEISGLSRPTVKRKCVRNFAFVNTALSVD
jgi:hypothetical protein